MKVGIIGLPQTGKKTLFCLLTGSHGLEKSTELHKQVAGTAAIKDPRLAALATMYPSKQEVMAKIEIALLPKIEKDTITGGEIFKEIADVDAICHVVRAFKDDAVYHPSGSIDPRRDIEMVNAELIIHDLIFLEKRIERIESNLQKVKDKGLQKEKALLLKLKSQLEKERPLRLLVLTSEEKKIIASYPLITLKKMILVLNVSDTDVKDEILIEDLKKVYERDTIDVMQVAAKLEAEIADLETEEERKEFLEALGIKEQALHLLTRICIGALGLLSFFTIGKDEVRQWLVRAGSTAPEAAGAVHTDMQRGFIRAEVMKYTDLVELKNEANVKHAGKYYVKGKDYLVEDGDIINIRFNV